MLEVSATTKLASLAHIGCTEALSALLVDFVINMVEAWRKVCICTGARLCI